MNRYNKLDAYPMTPGEQTAKRIILMEDNPSDVFLLRRALDQHQLSCVVEVVRDGEKALAMLDRLQSGTETMPDLVVLDLNLPRHDGIEVLARCRELPRLSKLPVMILTSSDSPKEKLRAEELAVTDFVRKPLMLDDFMALGARVKTLLDGKPSDSE